MDHLFPMSLFLTFFIARAVAHKFHDMKNYGTRLENSKTLTGFIRKNTGLDIHHFHFGVSIFIFSIFFFYLNINYNISIVLFGISLSLIADQIVPFFYKNFNYFSKKCVIISLSLHLFILLIATSINIIS